MLRLAALNDRQHRSQFEMTAQGGVVKSIKKLEEDCDGVGFAHFSTRPQLSTGAQTTDYRRGYSFSVLVPSSPCVPVGRAGCTVENHIRVMFDVQLML